MVRWMGQHATLRPVPGGAFEVNINGVPVRGQYLEIDPPRRVLVSWGVAGNPGMPPGATRAAAGDDPGPDPWHQEQVPSPLPGHGNPRP